MNTVHPATPATQARSIASIDLPSLEDLRQLGEFMRQSMAKRLADSSFTDEEAESMYEVALTLVAQGELERAHPVLARICDWRPGEIRYMRALAITRRELGELRSATALFQTISMLEPGQARNAVDLAECWLRGGSEADLEQAHRLLQLTVMSCDSTGVTGDEVDRARAMLKLLSQEGEANGSPSPAA